MYNGREIGVMPLIYNFQAENIQMKSLRRVLEISMTNPEQDPFPLRQRAAFIRITDQKTVVVPPHRTVTIHTKNRRSITAAHVVAVWIKNAKTL